MRRYKTAYCWWPRRLAKHNDKGFEFIGWVWRTRAFLVRNDIYGWIAFQEDQTSEKMDRCPYCKRAYHG